MGEITYAFIGTQKLNMKVFNEKVLKKITKIIGKENSKILVSDDQIILAKLLNNRKFVNVVVYHVGKAPKHSYGKGKFKLKGGFLTESEVENELTTNATKVYSF